MRKAVLPAALLAAGMAAPASAQSFNCGSASLAAERAVCGSDRLSALDERMSRLYDRAMASADGRDSQRLRSYQLNFLAARDACGRDTGCIKGAYLDQIEVLSARIRVAEESSD